MKTKIVLSVYIVILSILLSSCIKVDQSDIKYKDIKGKIVNQVTGEGIPNISFKIATVLKHQEGVVISLNEPVDFIEIETDENGNFAETIGYTELSNKIVFLKEYDENFTGFIEGFKEKTVADINDTNPFVLGIRKWEKLELSFKNTNPYDANDTIELSVYQYNTPVDRYVVTEIVNNGIVSHDNLFLHGHAWKGKSTDSMIKINIQNGTRFQVRWKVTKNAVTTSYSSDEIETISGIVNEFEINY